MKVGDLVELSAHGKGSSFVRERVPEIMHSVGVVLGPNPGRAGTWRVRWCGHEGNVVLPFYSFHRRELKFAKVEKKFE